MNGNDDTPRHFEPIPAEVERTASAAVDAVVAVHRALGPGLLESVYEACLCHELHSRGVSFAKQVPVPVIYRGVRLDADLVLDLLVEDKLIVEVKAVDALTSVHEAQLLTYLKLTGLRLGLLVNFNVAKIRHGIRRMVL